ncbi:flap endonuclease 1 [Triplophysa rosa]|uniref:Flap endonuclease 1 n=1 Tax=Triplophysa rosa TaxID=992332 RepID=A0A9W7T8U0_TRIRA|nr:flap endonuclease 1 [Triplophysa rosa]KAI7792852.1 Flap endonuclease 1 [Triplophysa rosa]
MGIHGLAKLIADHAPSAIKEQDMKNFFGRKIAIDASMCMYQFLIAVRQDGNVLQNEDGETTSHLMGMFYRTIRILESGIKPVYVFDGKPPQLKSGELEKRGERRAEAEKLLAQAQEAGEQENIDKFSKRLVKVTKQHNEECKRLLTLMGVPYIEAPCEAEASCAALVKTGKVYATATEDMDGLTFGTSILLRHLTASEAKKLPIQEFHFSRILQEMGLTHQQFIDLCILLGCDYCGTIKGIGPKRAIDLIKQHGSIEEILDNIDPNKHPAPEEWLYKEARDLFLEPEVVDCGTLELKWNEPDEDGLIQFMCAEKQFSEDRIRNGCKKITKSRQGSTQGRLDTFFTVTGSISSKRKEPETKGSAKKKQKTSATPGKFKKGK